MGLAKFIQDKLGITELKQEVAKLPRLEQVPALNERYLQLLTPLEELTKLMLRPEADDTLIMFHLRAMGYFGGTKVSEAYKKGLLHGGSERVRKLTHEEEYQND